MGEDEFGIKLWGFKKEDWEWIWCEEVWNVLNGKGSFVVEGNVKIGESGGGKNVVWCSWIWMREGLFGWSVCELENIERVCWENRVWDCCLGNGFD